VAPPAGASPRLGYTSGMRPRVASVTAAALALACAPPESGPLKHHPLAVAPGAPALPGPGGALPAADSGPRPDTGADSGADTGVPAPLGLAVAEVPAGTFWMGSPPDEPHRGADERRFRAVLGAPVLFAVHELTQGQFESLMGWNPAAGGTDPYGEPCDKGGVDPDLPVACVTWLDAVAAANALSRAEGLAPAYTIDGDDVAWDRTAAGWRLPTEVEWERAARAGQSFIYGHTDDPAAACTGGNLSDQTALANDPRVNYPFPCSDGSWLLTPPGRFGVNAYGVADLLGNVYEWVWDREGAYPPDDTVDWAGPDSGARRVRRGGGWHSGLPYARPAYRGETAPDETLHTLGVRFVRNVP